MKLSNRLETHFALCAVAVAVTAVVASTNADVVQWDCNVVVPPNIDGIYFNIELQTFGSSGGTVAGWDINPYSATGLVWYNAAGTGMMRFPGVTTGSAGNLAAGTVVSSIENLLGAGAVVFGGAPGNWVLGQDNLFAFKFRTAADGTTGVHYGYGIMAVGATASDRTVRSLFYESVAGAPITVVGGGPPPNYDPCAPFNPIAVAGSNSFYLNQTTAADLAVTGPCSFTAFKANYFKFVAPVAGAYTIDTCASIADTRLAVLNGCAAGSTVLACNDNSCGLSSSVTLTMSAQQIVYIVVGGSSASVPLPSPISVNVVAPPSPECESATVLAFGSNPFDNGASTITQVIQAATTTTSLYKASWMKFTPTVTGAYTFSLCGSVNDTKIAIGTTCPGSGLTFAAFAYNDDACACSAGCGVSLYSSSLNPTNTGVPLTQELTAGQAYRIIIGGYAAGTLATSGTVVIDGPPQTPPCPGDFNADGLRDGLDMATLLSSWGTAGGDTNGDGMTDGTDLSTLLGGWGLCP